MSKKILLVEDDKFLRELIGQKLITEGYDISVAVDGDECLNMVRQSPPNLVLLDLILPKTDGFSVLEKMKLDPALSEIPVIILSNLGQDEDIEKGMKLGAKDYMIKAHFTPAEIVDKVKLALS